jgi:hypothetical protein
MHASPAKKPPARSDQPNILREFVLLMFVLILFKASDSDVQAGYP